jgi:hypothetical protein
MELSDAIGSLIQDYADEIYWQKLSLYKETALIELPSSYDGGIPIGQGIPFECLTSRKKTALRAIIKQINFINIFFKMGEFSNRANKLPWCKTLAELYIDAISILLYGLTKERNLEGQVGFYDLKVGASELLLEALEELIIIQKKAKSLLREDGRLNTIGMRDVKTCEYALRELIKIHGPAME